MRSTLTVLLALGLARAGAQSAPHRSGATDSARIAAHERATTITRDSWGVAHIHGVSDADASFGLVYAQCENNFPAVERSLLRSQGRAAELDGPSSIDDDLLVRAFRFDALSRAEFVRAEAPVQAILRGAADGYNDYLIHHTGAARRLAHAEPWMFLSPDRHLLLFSVFDDDLGPLRLSDIAATLGGRPGQSGPITNAGLAAAEPAAHEMLGVGSNAAVLGPSRSASGHPLLLVNPHGNWFGAPVQEAEMQSDAGWHVAGTVISGGAVIALGHTEWFGWAHTTAQPRIGNAWLEHFDDSQDPLAYRYGAGHRRAMQWRDTLRVMQRDGSLRDSVVTFRATHHGPVVVVRGDSAWSMNFAGLREGGAVAEWYALQHAHTFAQVQRAVARLALPVLNVHYADTTGRIWYVYGAARVPRRDPHFDWMHPVDGADPRTDWQGALTLREHPQQLDPARGWVANANSSPFQLGEGTLAPKNFAPYLVREDRDAVSEAGAAYTWTWRAERMRELLGGDRKFTLGQFEHDMLDSRWIAFRRPIAMLVAAWDSLARQDPGKAERMRAPVAALREWKLDVDSATHGLVLLAAWAREGNRMIGGRSFLGGALDLPPGSPGRVERFDALRPVVVATFERALARMDSSYGTWRVPYGSVYRVQRPANDEPAKFNAHAPSLASPGASLSYGSLFAAWTAPPVDGLRFVTGGSGYVSVMEIGSPITTRSITWFGESADSTSPHYLDQQPLFATRRMRPQWFGADVREHVESSYHPGS